MTQAVARTEALATLADQGILAVWQVVYQSRQGRRWLDRVDAVLDFATARRKAGLFQADPAHYRRVAVKVLHVFTHDYPTA